MSNPKDTKTMRSLVEAANSIDEARDFNDPNRIKDDLTPDQRMLQSNALTLLHGVIDAASKRTVELQRFSREAQGILTTVRTNPSNPLDDITAEALHNLLSTGVELGIVKKNVPELFTGMAKGKINPKWMR